MLKQVHLVDEQAQVKPEEHRQQEPGAKPRAKERPILENDEKGQSNRRQDVLAQEERTVLST